MNKIMGLLLGSLYGLCAYAEPSYVPALMKQFAERAQHFVEPNMESDEAYKAAHQKIPTMTQGDLDKLVRGSSEDYFQNMDNGLTKSDTQSRQRLLAEMRMYIPGIASPEDAVSRVARGRANWIVWTGGNDKFWTDLIPNTLSGMDFLKTVSSYKGDPEHTLPALRSNRWEKLGVINEPCFAEPIGGDSGRFGLWLDQRQSSVPCGPRDPFADESKYPGIKIGQRGQTLRRKDGTTFVFPVGSFYGEPSGIVGLRLFTNPDFNQKAYDRWDANRYYTDPEYYNDPSLVRPYRVGMACAFCHVGPSPSHPPKNFEAPEWEDLGSNLGAQYFRFNRIFFWNFEKSSNNFLYQVISTYRPGALDTSLVASDQINNPRTMNAVYNLPARVMLAHKMNHRELLKDNEQLNAQFSNIESSSPIDGIPGSSMLRDFAEKSARPSWVETPRVLKDGSDSVGALGALNRVFVNIGLFSEEWVMNFLPLLGGRKITPFRIDLASDKSLYWKATISQTPDLALYFLLSSRPDKLSDLANAKKYFDPAANIEHGRELFARNCAQCHSSKLPEKAYSFFNQPGKPDACVGSNYTNCWRNYWDAYARTDEFKNEMVAISKDAHFLTHGKFGDTDFLPADHNYLSTELRIPASLSDSNLCSPIATNAIKGNIWDNFASSSYKALPSIDSFKGSSIPMFKAAQVSMVNGQLSTYPVENPIPAGGRGYIRSPSLVSLWSTAPFLVNNSLGIYKWGGSTDDRIASFNDSIFKLLHPDQRGTSGWPGEQAVSFVTNFGDTLTGVVDVTTQPTYIQLPKGYLPKSIYWLIKAFMDRHAGAKQALVSPSKEKLDVSAIDSILRHGGRKVAQAAADDYTLYYTDNDQAYTNTDSADMLTLGRIPAGVPINLISNINLSAPLGDLKNAIEKLLEAVLMKNATAQMFMDKAGAALLKVSKCNDFVVNRGHYFGTEYFHKPGESLNKNTGSNTVTRTNDLDILSENDKTDLIEYLKTM